MSDFPDSIMVALFPTTEYWCTQELPHLTLVYAGKIQDVPSTVKNDLAKEVISIAFDFGPVSVPVTGVEIFGDDEPVDVLRLELTDELKAMRSRLEYWNLSQYKEFKPHSTIGEVGSYSGTIPPKLLFDRIGLVWGDQTIISDLF